MSVVKTFRLAKVHRKLQQALRESDAASSATFLGSHVLGEFFDCARLPEDVETIKELMETAADRIGATVVQSVFHTFNPYGLSGVVVIAESHLSVHTWPEYRCACVDVFTCSPDLNPRIGFDYLKEQFGARYCDVIELPRGAGAKKPFAKLCQ